jgi:hypothetical protein
MARSFFNVELQGPDTARGKGDGRFAGFHRPREGLRYATELVLNQYTTKSVWVQEPGLQARQAYESKHQSHDINPGAKATS